MGTTGSIVVTMMSMMNSRSIDLDDDYSKGAVIPFGLVKEYKFKRLESECLKLA